MQTLINTYWLSSCKTEQGFVLSIYAASSNGTAAGMTLFIDGVVVKDNTNQPLVFAPAAVFTAGEK
jgi:hypothetical protein